MNNVRTAERICRRDLGRLVVARLISGRLYPSSSQRDVYPKRGEKSLTCPRQSDAAAVKQRFFEPQPWAALCLILGLPAFDDRVERAPFPGPGHYV